MGGADGFFAWGNGRAKVGPAPDGGKALLLMGGKGYALDVEGTLGPLSDQGTGQEWTPRDSPAADLLHVLAAPGRQYMGSATDTYRHWEGCGACRRCKALEERARRFVETWGMLGLTPASRWGYGGRVSPAAAEWARLQRCIAWEPLARFLQHAGRLQSWCERYAEADGDPQAQPSWRSPFFHGAGSMGDYAHGREDPRLLHPGLNAVLARARPSIVEDWRMRKAADGAEVLDGRPARSWRIPSLWVAIHLQVYAWVLYPGRVMRRCERRDCGRVFLVNPTRDHRYPRRFCDDTCRMSEARRRSANRP